MLYYDAVIGASFEELAARCHCHVTETFIQTSTWYLLFFQSDLVARNIPLLCCDVWRRISESHMMAD